MPTNKNTAIKQIDEVLKHDSAIEESVTLACAAIKRLSPPESAYLDRMNAALKLVLINGSTGSKNTIIITALHGILSALRIDYNEDRLMTYEELINANLFSDFLEMAEYLLKEKYKDSAAVIAGGVLEEHLRKLSNKYDIALPDKPKLDSMNVELTKKNAYSKNDQKQVLAWAGIRNDAAHGKYNNYVISEVILMVTGIRDFLSRNPA